VREPDAGLAPANSARGAVKTMEQLEREAILHAIGVAKNDKRKAAAMLGISRAKVYQRLKDWGMTGADRALG
jgi:DNA-binding NtrC family response regulator